MRSNSCVILLLGAALCVLSGCATNTVGLSRILKLHSDNTLSVLTLLPDQASVILNRGLFSKDPVRIVPASGWSINQVARRSLLEDLERKNRFRVIGALPHAVQRWLVSQQVRQGIELSKKTLPEIQKPVAEMGTQLVLVLAPGTLFHAGVRSHAAMAWFAGPVVAAVVSGPEHPLGLGYGVIQHKVLDSRHALTRVDFQVWLLNRRDGTAIARTGCRASLVRLDGEGKTNPLVKVLWIHRKDPIAPANLTYTKSRILALTSQAIWRCLHNLKLS